MQTTTTDPQKAQRRQIHLDPDFASLKTLLQLCRRKEMRKWN